MIRIASLCFAALMILHPAANAEESAAAGDASGNTPRAGQKTVLITGATRGIGLRTTELLSESGYFVFAGARKDEDMARLDKLPNVKSIRLDVTDQEQIAAAVKTVEEYGAGLYGLVNNAGITKIKFLNNMDEADFDLIMQVNAYGPFRVTKAFAPLIKAASGRIVNISSVGGVDGAAMGVGAYLMSKHALEAFTDVQSIEMRQYGVHVSAVEPGNYGGPEVKGGDKLDVALAVKDALTSETPKVRYLVTPDEKHARKAIKAQFRRMLELNEQHKYTMTLQELTNLLKWQYGQKFPDTEAE